MTRVSVIVPCRNEAPYIRACLESILATTWPRERLEVLVVDGRSDDGTRAIVASVAEHEPAVRLLDNPRRIVPCALNAGIRAASGDIIARMDAHVIYPPDYLPLLVAALERSGADNVGGCIRTRPAGSGAMARAVALALAHPFGVGNAHFRVGTPSPRYVDTVPFGCWKRDVFRRIGLFDEDLVRNQDDEFNHRLRRHGGRLLLLPHVVSDYYARGSLRQVARMFYQYGRFKPLVVRKVGRVMTLRPLVPPLFVATLAAAALLAPWSTAAGRVLALVAGAYASVVGAAALAALPRVGGRAALALLAVFPTLHVGYGLGFLRGAAALLFRRRAAWAPARTIPLSR